MLATSLHGRGLIMESSIGIQVSRSELLAELEMLRATEQELRVLLDESSDPIFAFFPDGQYRYVNHAFAEGVGKKRDEIIGKRIWDVFSREEADKRFAVVRWVFENAEIRTIEVRVPRAEGDRYYLTTVKPIIGEHAQVLSVICISKDITERREMEQKLKHMAQHDVLTGLPNRALFEDRVQKAIAQAKRDGTRLALMSIDLDRFKPVNDSFGHHVGDVLLQVTARRMLDSVRESDSIGRIGGDEFLVLLPVLESVQDALTVADKIHRNLSQPFDLPEHPDIRISSCIGIALYPDHGDDTQCLYRNADKAMYQAKSQGGNRVWALAEDRRVWERETSREMAYRNIA